MAKRAGSGAVALSAAPLVLNVNVASEIGLLSRLGTELLASLWIQSPEGS